MARFLKYNWLAAAAGQICSTQTVVNVVGGVATGGFIALNGSFQDPTQGNVINLVGNGSARTIKVTMTAVTDGTTTFAVIGTQNGQRITENIAIAANGTNGVSTNIYSTIISIKATNPTTTILSLTGVVVNIDKQGLFPLIKLNPDVSPSYGGPFWALSVSAGGALDCTVAHTLDEITPGYPIIDVDIDELLPVFFPVPVEENSDIFLCAPTFPSGGGGVGVSVTNTLYYTNQIVVLANATAITSTGVLIFRQT